MGAVSPHPTLGRCVKKCTPSKKSHQVLKLQQKFPVLIKKFRKKPFRAPGIPIHGFQKHQTALKVLHIKKNGENVKMGVKFLAQIKKFREKPFWAPEIPMNGPPALKTSDVFPALRQSPLKVMKNVLASRLGIVGG